MSGDNDQTNITAPDATPGIVPDPATTAPVVPVVPSADDAQAKFTQAQVDRIAGDTRKQVRAQFADYENLKARAAKLEEIETAQLSELEQARKRADDAQAQAELALQTSQDRLVRAEFIAAAAAAGAEHPGDAYSLADRSTVALDESGNVTGVEEAVAALVEQGRLVMPGKPKPPNLNGGAGDGERPPVTAIKLSVEQTQAAKNFGITPEEYAAQTKKE